MIKVIKEDGDSMLLTKDGETSNTPAVYIEWGFATGSDTGQHCFCNSCAYAELGELNEDGDFIRDAYKDADYGKKIFAKSIIGWPKCYEAYNPEPNDDFETEFEAWCMDAAEKLLA